MKPWHDTVIHEAADGKECGPVSPARQCYDPSDTTDIHAVQCCACGKQWRELDVRRLVQIWWSAGAYEGALESGGSLDT